MKIPILGAIIFINLILLLFLWERNAVVIPNDIPSIANVQSQLTRSDIKTKLVGTSKHGAYLVEDYQDVVVWYDQNGHIMKQVPTSDHTYLRYWIAKKGKVIVDDTGD